MNPTNLLELVKIILSLKSKVKCPICLDFLENSAQLECTHTFCSVCLLEHKLQNLPLCPICKAPINKRATVYKDHFSDNLSKFVNRACQYIKETYAYEVHELNTTYEKLQEIIETAPQDIGAPAFHSNFKPVLPKKPVENPFDSLVRRPVTRCYVNKKKQIDIMNKPKVLNFNNEDNRTKIINWLIENQEKLNTLTQSPSLFTDSDNVDDVELPSISQVSVAYNVKQQQSNLVRSQSLIFENNKENKVNEPLLKRYHSLTEGLNEDDYDIEEVHSETFVKQVELKVLQDILEEECLANMDCLAEPKSSKKQQRKKETPDKKGKNTRNKNKIASLPNSGTSSGWDRIKDVRKTLKHASKEPKKLDISLQECNSLSAKKSPKESAKYSPAESDKKKKKSSGNGAKDPLKSVKPKKSTNASKTVEDKENLCSSQQDALNIDKQNESTKQTFNLSTVENYFEKNIKNVKISYNLNDSSSDVEMELSNRRITEPKEQNDAIKTAAQNTSCDNNLGLDEDIFFAPTQPTPQTINQHIKICQVIPVPEEITEIENIAIRLEDNLRCCISAASKFDISMSRPFVECFTNLKTYVDKLLIKANETKEQTPIKENATKSIATQTDAKIVSCKETQCNPTPKKSVSKHVQTSQNRQRNIEVQTCPEMLDKGVQSAAENLVIVEENEEQFIDRSICYKSSPANISKTVSNSNTKISKPQKSSQTHNGENLEQEENQKSVVKKSSQNSNSHETNQSVKSKKPRCGTSTQDSFLVCSVEPSNSKKSDKKVNRKLTYEETQSRKFKRIRTPADDSESDNEKPSKKKFMRDDLTIEFLDTDPGSNNDCQINAATTSDSENVDYDKYLLEVMEKYGTPPPPSKKSSQVNRTSRQSSSQVSSNSQKRKVKNPIIDSESPKTSSEYIFTAQMAFEENLDKFEKEILQFENVTKTHSSEYDLVENTPMMSPKAKKPRVSNKKKESVKDCMKEPLQILSKGSVSGSSLKKKNPTEEASAYLSPKEPSTLNRNIENVPSQTEECPDDYAEILEDLRNDEDFFKSQIESDEKKPPVKLSLSQCNAKDSDKAEENLEALDDDIIENELKKISFTAEEKKASEKNGGSIKVLQNILLHCEGNSVETKKINNGIECSDVDFESSIESDTSDEEIVETTPQKSKNNSRDRSILRNIEEFENDALDVCIPPPPGFGDEFETGPTTNKSPDHLSSLTPDLLTDFITSLDMIKQENTQKDNINQSFTFDKPTVSKLPTKNVGLSSPGTQLSPQILTDINYAGENFSPVAKSTMKFTQNKFTPLVTTPRLSIKKTNLMTSTPNQKSILNYVRSSQEKATPSKQRTIPCIMWSRIVNEDVNVFNQLSLRKLATTSNTFNSQVTHLVVLVDEKGQIVSHTAKILTAIAAGIWVVRYEWAKDCLKQNRIVPEEPYEVLDATGVDGPRISRLTRSTNPLFKGFRFYCCPPFLALSKNDLEIILQLTGAEIAKNLENLLREDDKINIILTESSASEETEQFENLLQIYKAVTVDVEWLTRCIGQYKLVSFRPFLVSGDDSNICDLGYPATLVESMPYTFTQT